MSTDKPSNDGRRLSAAPTLPRYFWKVKPRSGLDGKQSSRRNSHRPFLLPLHRLDAIHCRSEEPWRAVSTEYEPFHSIAVYWEHAGRVYRMLDMLPGARSDIVTASHMTCSMAPRRTAPSSRLTSVDHWLGYCSSSSLEGDKMM